jgi:hypothetical protein
MLCGISIGNDLRNKILKHSHVTGHYIELVWLEEGRVVTYFKSVCQDLSVQTAEKNRTLQSG